MFRSYPSGPFALAIAVLVGLALAGCNDDVVYVEDGPPAVPAGVATITGDGQVEILWYPVREDDVAGYGVYRSRTLDGAYDRLATVHGADNDSYVDHDVVNGQTYYYAVDAFDRAGHESDLSYEDAFDTPRPAGTGVTLYTMESDPARAGLDWSDWDRGTFVASWNAPDTDLYVQRTAGVLHMVGTEIGGYWNDIQDLGWTSSMDDVSWSPADGWSVSPNGVELIRGHTYAVWTHDNFFAKFRVVDILGSPGTPTTVVIDWAYQIDQGNQELRNQRRPERKTVPGSDSIS